MTSFNGIKNTLFESYSKDSGKLLIHAGAIGWLFSSLAQISIVATDNNISKKDKKFLIPQEICDGATNVALYYTISKIIKESGDWLINHGYILTDDMHNLLIKLKSGTVSDQEAIKAIVENLKYDKAVISKKENAKLLKELGDKKSKVAPGKILESELKKPLNAIYDHITELAEFKALPKNYKEEVLTLITKTRESASCFKNGIGVITSVIASIIASNILTPIVRNKMAGVYQQKFLMKEDKAKKTGSAKPAQFNTALPPAFKTFNISGSMKI